MFIINENCRFCNTCLALCPVNAIEKTYPIYTINAELCIACGQCEENCSFGAIVWQEN